MTRETKLGILVGSSLICLLALVFVRKWMQWDKPEGRTEVAQVAEVPSPGKTQEPGKITQAVAMEAGPLPGEDLAHPPEASPARNPAAPPAPSLPSIPEPPAPSGPGVGLPNVPTPPSPMPSPSPSPRSADPLLNVSPNANGPGKEEETLKALQEQARQLPRNPLPAAPSTDPVQIAQNTAPSLDPLGRSQPAREAQVPTPPAPLPNAPPALPTPPTPTPSAPAPSAPTPGLPLPSGPAPTAPAAGTPELPGPPTPTPSPAAPPAPVGPPAIGPGPVTPLPPPNNPPAANTPTLPGLPAADVRTPVNPPMPPNPANVDVRPSEPGIPGPSDPRNQAPTVDNGPPGSRFPGPGANQAGPPTAPLNGPNQVPVVGAAPPVGSPPIRVQTPNNPPSSFVPVVKDYDVRIYRCGPGDTSFEEISKKAYYSDKYGRALLLFNRNEQQAAESIRQDPPRLQPGLEVFIPPLEILESKYASEIRDYRPLPGVGQPQPNASFVPSAPVPNAFNPSAVPNGSAVNAGLSTAQVPPIAARPVGNPATSDPTKLYVVRGNPEYYFEIARKTLNDGQRWAEIWRLNPGTNPEAPLPPGTQVRLPAYARVDP